MASPASPRLGSFSLHGSKTHRAIGRSRPLGHSSPAAHTMPSGHSWPVSIHFKEGWPNGCEADEAQLQEVTFPLAEFDCQGSLPVQ